MCKIPVLNKGLDTYKINKISIPEAKIIGEQNIDNELYIKAEDGNNYIIKDFTNLGKNGLKVETGFKGDEIKLVTNPPSKAEKWNNVAIVGMTGAMIGGSGMYASSGINGLAKITGSALTSKIALGVFLGSMAVGVVGLSVAMVGAKGENSHSYDSKGEVIDPKNIRIEVQGKEIKGAVVGYDYGDYKKHEEIVDSPKNKKFDNPVVDAFVSRADVMAPVGCIASVSGFLVSKASIAPLMIKTGGAIAVAGTALLGLAIAASLIDIKADDKIIEQTKQKFRDTDPLNNNLTKVK